MGRVGSRLSAEAQRVSADMAVCMTGLWELGLSRRSEEAKGVRGARAPSLLAAAAACVWALAAHQPSPTTSRPDDATLSVPDPVPRRGPRAPWHGASDFQKCQCRQTAPGARCPLDTAVRGTRRVSTEQREWSVRHRLRPRVVTCVVTRQRTRRTGPATSPPRDQRDARRTSSPGAPRASSTGIGDPRNPTPQESPAWTPLPVPWPSPGTARGCRDSASHVEAGWVCRSASERMWTGSART